MTFTDFLSVLQPMLRGECGFSAGSGFRVPRPKNVVFQKKRIKLCDKDGQPLRDKDGRRIAKEGGYVTTVMFDDGIQTQVVQGEHDAFDLEKAVLYAVAKRVYGKTVEKKDKDGRDVIVVEGDGYNAMLKKVCCAAVDQDQKRVDAEKRRAALKEKNNPAPVKAKTERKSAEATENVDLSQLQPARKTTRKTTRKKAVKKAAPGFRGA